jgi:heptosyltransferase-2
MADRSVPRTILLFLFGDLGDTILTTPAIRAIRIRHPAARLVLVGKPVAAHYVRALGFIDDVIEVDKHAFDRPGSLVDPRALLYLWRLIRRLRAERADTVIVFHHLVTWWGTIKFALLSLATGAGSRLGLDGGKGMFLTRSVRDYGFGARHEAEYWLEVAGLLDAAGSLEVGAPIGAEERREAVALLGEATCDGTLIAIHAGTGWYGPGRRWAAERFAAAAEIILAQTHDAHCVLVGTDVDREASETVLARLGARATNLVGRTGVGQLAAVLERCALLIANDGGVAHLASAAGTPVLAVFGPSNDAAWRPLGSTVVAADLPCRPCFYRDSELGLPRGCASRECLELVTPEAVAAAAADILSERAVAV